MNYRKLLLLSLPAMLAIGLEPVAGLIDTIVLGQKNILWVSGLGATNAVLSSLAWVFNFLSYGVTGRIGRAYGSGDLKQMSSLLNTALLLSLAIGLLLGLPLIFSGPYILANLFELQGNTLTDSITYWNIRLISYPLTVLSMTFVGILRGMQKITNTLWMVAASTAINAVLTYTLVFPLDYGIKGAALGTLAGFLISVLLGFYFILAELKKLSLPWQVKFDSHVFSDFSGDAVNLFVRTGLLTLSFFILTIVVSKIGPLHLASHQIALQVWLLSAFILDGFAITGTSYGSRLLGQNKTQEFITLSQKLLILGSSTGLVMATVYWLAKPLIYAVFTKDLQVYQILDEIFILVCWSQPLNALVYVADGLIFASSAMHALRNGMLFGFFALFLPIILVSSLYSPNLSYYWWSLVFLAISRLGFSLKYLFSKRNY